MPKPTLDHPRRCQAVFKTGKRGPCMRWALLGSRFCEFHGGRRKSGKNIVRDANISMRYKRLHGALHDYVKEQVDAPSMEQVSLFEELALMRHRADQMVGIYAASLAVTDEAKRQQLVQQSGDMMAACIRDVAFLAEQASKLNTPNIVTTYDVQQAVDNVIMMMAEVFGDDSRIDKFNRELKARLKIKAAPGTDITPDRDVLDMDATIPEAPE